MPKKVKDAYDRKIPISIEVRYMVLAKQEGYNSISDYIEYLLSTISHLKENIASMQKMISQQQNQNEV